MRRTISILVLVAVSFVSVFAAGCASDGSNQNQAPQDLRTTRR
jgi:hypothetical protein